MEKRKITVIPTKTHKTQVIESAATTLAELKADLTKAGMIILIVHSLRVLLRLN